jgi:predicted TIM-barrel fold metal-dependent hydrolase
MAIELGKTEAEKIMFAVDEAWLAKGKEEILEPDLPIIDPHHHLWDRGSRYLFDELLADLNTGHNIRATCYLQCDTMYDAGASELMAPVGETEYVNGVAAMGASGMYGPAKICAGIVSYADLKVGKAVEPVLDAHVRVSSRMRGIRHCAVWDADRTIKSTPMEFPRHLLLDPTFREGVALLRKYNLCFETLIYHTQLPELTDLARAFPDIPMVLDHVGIPLAIGVYAGKTKEVTDVWRKGLEALATCPNVSAKLGGMGMHLFGSHYKQNPMPPTSTELADTWRPWVEPCIQIFGPDRCMFESNFPVDKQSCSYAVLWNAFKRLAQGYSAGEKAALFFGTAKRVYRLAV